MRVGGFTWRRVTDSPGGGGRDSPGGGGRIHLGEGEGFT